MNVFHGLNIALGFNQFVHSLLVVEQPFLLQLVWGLLLMLNFFNLI